MRRAILVLCLQLCACSSFADAVAHPLVMGVGNDKCTLVIESFAKASEAGQSKHAQWLLGFFAASNFFNLKGDTASYFWYDEIRLIEYAQRFCNENPELRLYNAIERFYDRRWVISP
jgi:hypothetical protein